MIYEGPDALVKRGPITLVLNLPLNASLHCKFTPEGMKLAYNLPEESAASTQNGNSAYRASYLRGLLPGDSGYKQARAEALKMWPESHAAPLKREG